MFQDSSGEDENTGISCEEPFYKLERVVECKFVTETNEKHKGKLAKERNVITPDT